MEAERITDPICSIVKPEPRTIKPEQPSCKAQISDPSFQPESSTHNPNITPNPTDLPSLASSSFTSAPSPSNSDLSEKNMRKTRWTSSPPSRRDSAAAAGGGSYMFGDSAAAGQEPRASSKTTESPVKRRGNSTDCKCVLLFCPDSVLSALN